MSEIKIERRPRLDLFGGYQEAEFYVSLPFPQGGYVTENPRFKATLKELAELRDFLTGYMNLQPEDEGQG